MAKPKSLPDDYHSDDTWLTDRGPHHCIFCGYDIITKSSNGTKAKILSEEEVTLPNLPGFRWHKDCAGRDPKLMKAANLVAEGISKARNLLSNDS